MPLLRQLTGESDSHDMLQFGMLTFETRESVVTLQRRKSFVFKVGPGKWKHVFLRRLKVISNLLSLPREHHGGGLLTSNIADITAFTITLIPLKLSFLLSFLKTGVYPSKYVTTSGHTQPLTAQNTPQFLSLSFCLFLSLSLFSYFLLSLPYLHLGFICALKMLISDSGTSGHNEDWVSLQIEILVAARNLSARKTHSSRVIKKCITSSSRSENGLKRVVRSSAWTRVST